MILKYLHNSDLSQQYALNTLNFSCKAVVLSRDSFKYSLHASGSFAVTHTRKILYCLSKILLIMTFPEGFEDYQLEQQSFSWQYIL